MGDFLINYPNKENLYIITTKKLIFVHKIFSANNIVLIEENIRDTSGGLTKRQIIEEIIGNRNVEPTQFYFVDKLNYETSLLKWKSVELPQIKENLNIMLEYLKQIPNESFTEKFLEKNLLEYIKENKYKNGDMLWPLRVALSGQKASPGPFEIAGVLGKEKSLARIEAAINLI